MRSVCRIGWLAGIPWPRDVTDKELLEFAMSRRGGLIQGPPTDDDASGSAAAE
jgi:hypothetical protein